MNFRIAVCDDDSRVYMQIRDLLEGNLDKYSIDYYDSGESLIKANKKYNLIFLDIEMGKMNGLRTAKVLRDSKREDNIVFLTTHLELMAEAFKVKAFRFLGKPLQKQKFLEALSEAEAELLDNETVLVPSEGEKHMLQQKHIVYIESLGDESCVHTIDRQYVTGKSLKYWEENINPSVFFKIHKSYIVNLAYVKTISATDVILTEEAEVLPIARRKKADFQKAYMNYVKDHARVL